MERYEIKVDVDPQVIYCHMRKNVAYVDGKKMYEVGLQSFALAIISLINLDTYRKTKTIYPYLNNENRVIWK